MPDHNLELPAPRPALWPALPYLAIISSYISDRTGVISYGTAHIQVYKQTRVMRCALRNFEDNSRVGLMLHKEYTAHERLLMS